MISTPVFLSLRVTMDMPFMQAMHLYLIDLYYTIPAYLLIFLVLWYFISRYQYYLWDYSITMAFGQTMGDGGLFFFAAAPGMLLFLPYPMTNYHALNILPFLAYETI